MQYSCFSPIQIQSTFIFTVNFRVLGKNLKKILKDINLWHTVFYANIWKPIFRKKILFFLLSYCSFSIFFDLKSNYGKTKRDRGLIFIIIIIFIIFYTNHVNVELRMHKKFPFIFKFFIPSKIAILILNITFILLFKNHFNFITIYIFSIKMFKYV